MGLCCYGALGFPSPSLDVNLFTYMMLSTFFTSERSLFLYLDFARMKCTWICTLIAKHYVEQLVILKARLIVMAINAYFIYWAVSIMSHLKTASW